MPQFTRHQLSTHAGMECPRARWQWTGCRQPPCQRGRGAWMAAARSAMAAIIWRGPAAVAGAPATGTSNGAA
eukprot:966775-Pyramimonas_sp.AAC.1